MENHLLMSTELHGDHGSDRAGGHPELDIPHSPEERATRVSSRQDEDLISVCGTDSPRASDLEDHDQEPTSADKAEENEDEKVELRRLRREERLHRSGYILLLVALYASFVVFAWVVLCILTYRPIAGGMKSYGVSYEDRQATYGRVTERFFYAIFTKSARYLQAAEFIQSAVTVVTIPLTSSVCSKAAVAFTQRRNQRQWSLRQTMVLADRGWTDPFIYFRLLSGGFKQYASSFLFLAIFLNVLGGIIAPIQSLYVSTVTIKRPTMPVHAAPLTDILYLATRQPGSKPDGNEIVLQTRYALTTASNVVPQSRLWTGEPINCSAVMYRESATGDLSEACNLAMPGKTFGNMSLLSDPFLAQLPSDYGTGLLRQYLPRINSTARRISITASEFPADCDSQPSAFYVKYGDSTAFPEFLYEWSNWGLAACMPADSTRPPWRPTRDRQDFSEHLYLNLSGVATSNRSLEQNEYFLITVNTTAAYFELPNYANGQKPGPLLDRDPIPAASCGSNNGGNCSFQTSLVNPSEEDIRGIRIRRADENDTTMIGNNTQSLHARSNRGPLLTISLALFGEGSFIEDRMSRPTAYMYPNLTLAEKKAQPRSDVCADRAPFVGLLRAEDGTGGGYYDLMDEGCLKQDVHTHDDVQEQLFAYAKLFFFNSFDGTDGERITNAFNSAAFLANEAWLTSVPDPYYRSWSVSQDYGADAVVPVISPTGIILISALKGSFLIIILGLAIYATMIPRWTDQLDSFAMLRIGASIPGDVPFRPASETRKIRALDRLPGWIGDATEGEGKIAQLGLGARGRLRGGRSYAAYDLDM